MAAAFFLGVGALFGRFFFEPFCSLVRGLARGFGNGRGSSSISSASSSTLIFTDLANVFLERGGGDGDLGWPMSSSKTLEVEAFFGLKTPTSSSLLPEEGIFKGFDLVLGEEESVFWPLDVLILESPVSVESDPLVFLGDDDIEAADVDALGFLEDGDREVELVLAFEPLVLFGDLELDFLGGRGECPGLIELSNSLYCFLANRLPICIVIKTFRSFKPSAFTTLAPPPDC